MQGAFINNQYVRMPYENQRKVKKMLVCEFHKRAKSK